MNAQSHFHLIRASAVALLIAGSCAVFALEAPHELTVQASLPQALQAGPRHSIADPVRSDGYLNRYTLKSDFGEFDVHSTALLKIRITELDALAQLAEMSKTKIFTDAAVAAGVSQIKSLQTFATQPVDTLKAAPAGVGRLFKKVRRKSAEAIDAGKEYVSNENEEEASEAEGETDGEEDTDQAEQAKNLLEQHFGVTDAERRWAERLGTDPYSSNELLRSTIRDYAKIDRLGNLTAKLSPIPSIPGADYIATVNKLAWSKDPYELKDYNLARLAEIGIDEEAADAFFGNAYLSPSLQTQLISAIVEMDGVANRGSIIESVTPLDNEVTARFFVDTVTMLAAYHTKREPLVAILDNNPLPTARGAGDKTVLLLPVDYLFWTDTAETFASRVDPGPVETWLVGSASAQAQDRMLQRGWSVQTWE